MSFEELLKLNVNDKTEKKKTGNATLTYLSWSYAWQEFVKMYPEATYEIVKDDIDKMRELYSSGSLTSLQKTAKENQKWPLLNLVRQILKSNNFKMDPIRKSNGYTKEGKKKYLRFFIIKKINSTKETEEIENSIV